MNCRYFWANASSLHNERLAKILSNYFDGFETEDAAVEAFKHANHEFPWECPRELELIKVYSTYRWEE
jgi:hypothetical protein